MERNIATIRNYVNTTKEPTKDIDICCDSPYECAYKKYCWKHIPEQSVFDIRGLRVDKKFDYYHKGIITYGDIIKNHPRTNDTQMRQVETAYYYLADSIDKGHIKEFLNTHIFDVILSRSSL